MAVAERLKLAVNSETRIRQAPAKLTNSDSARWGSSLPSAAPA
jgi:hypothetical protein